MKETLNIENAVKSTKHSIFYYTNFIEQIEENKIHDLNKRTFFIIFMVHEQINSFKNLLEFSSRELEQFSYLVNLLFLTKKNHITVIS